MYKKFSLSHVSDFLKWFSSFTNIHWLNTSLFEYVNDFYAFEDSLATVTHEFNFFFLVRCWTRWWIESQPCREYPECYMTWPLSPQAPQSGSSVMSSYKRGLLCPRLKQIKLVLDKTVKCDTVIKVSNFYMSSFWLVSLLTSDFCVV